jgi:hypothetical protein
MQLKQSAQKVSRREAQAVCARHLLDPTRNSTLKAPL